MLDRFERWEQQLKADEKEKHLEETRDEQRLEELDKLETESIK